MSKQELRQQLLTWKSHCETHYRKEDGILFKFLDDLLSKLPDEEPKEEALGFKVADDEGPGGNNPGGPIIP